MRYAPRAASTSYRVLRREGHWALVLAMVSRALRHQIRSHFAAIEHPLAGDVLYGGPTVAGFDRHALHASRVAFESPEPGLRFDVSSEVPAALLGILKTSPPPTKPEEGPET